MVGIPIGSGNLDFQVSWVPELQRLPEWPGFRTWVGAPMCSGGSFSPTVLPSGPLTFALQALAEQTLEQFLASLAHGGPCVAVYQEGVRHLDFGQQHLVQLNGTACVEGGGRGGGGRRGWSARKQVGGATALPSSKSRRNNSAH